MQEIQAGSCLGEKLLILGDVNTGKTTLSRRILEDFCQRGLGQRIGILDLAPHIPQELAFRKGLAGVGGNLVPPDGCGVIHVAPRLDAPRLSSSSEAEAIGKARRNGEIVDALLRDTALRQRDILFVNDITMYLQAGSAENLIAHLAQAQTLVANGYWGERLGAGVLTLRERAQTQKVMAWFDGVGKIVRLER